MRISAQQILMNKKSTSSCLCTHCNWKKFNECSETKKLDLFLHRCSNGNLSGITSLVRVINDEVMRNGFRVILLTTGNHWHFCSYSTKWRVKKVFRPFFSNRLDCIWVLRYNLCHFFFFLIVKKTYVGCCNRFVTRARVATETDGSQ